MSWAVDTNIIKHFTQSGTREHAESVQTVKDLWMCGERLTTFAQCMSGERRTLLCLESGFSIMKRQQEQEKRIVSKRDYVKAAQ